jgi:hypothetical protein
VIRFRVASNGDRLFDIRTVPGHTRLGEKLKSSNSSIRIKSRNPWIEWQSRLMVYMVVQYLYKGESETLPSLSRGTNRGSGKTRGHALAEKYERKRMKYELITRKEVLQRKSSPPRSIVKLYRVTLVGGYEANSMNEQTKRKSCRLR